MSRSSIELAADDLRRTSRRFTRKNLFHAWRRRTGSAVPFAEFASGRLVRRLARGPIEGLLPPSAPWRSERLPREWDAYFPKAILLVDRLEVLDLFVASDVLATTKLAVVCVDGSPPHVVEWLARGFRAGRRAPVGFLHDAATSIYPFVLEPLASLVDAARGEPIAYRDLGFPRDGMPRERLPFPDTTGRDDRFLELEAPPPCALVAYAARRMLAMVPGDPMMAPLAKERTAEGGAR